MNRDRLATLSIASLVALSFIYPSVATEVNEIFSYDGSYAPNSGTPPAGQSTWTVNITTPSTISPNVPSAGIATFSDPGNGLISAHKTYADTEFINNPAEYEWSYTFTFGINTNTVAYTGPSVAAPYGMIAGVRDEGGNGKVVALGVDKNDGSLDFQTSSFQAKKFDITSGIDFRDGVMRTVRVEKRLVDATMRVQVYVDDVAQFVTPPTYTSFDNDGIGNGFGFFTFSANGKVVAEIDVMQFGPLPSPPKGTVVLIR